MCCVNSNSINLDISSVVVGVFALALLTLVSESNWNKMKILKKLECTIEM